MLVSIRQEVQDEIRSKVKAYAKIISGQSQIFKNPPNNINTDSIIKHYTKINAENFVKDFKLPKVSANRYAKDLTKNFVYSCIQNCNF